VSAVLRTADGVAIMDETGSTLATVDELVSVTGLRPDLTPLRELRLDLDPIMEAPKALAPLIDPNLHSCGTVPPHGEAELRQPEPGFYVVGMKSYGRAPTFLMLTGYEQVRSIACALTGDAAGAAAVELTLPETGVCSAPRPSEAGEAALVSSCCGGPAASEVDACCAQDADAKAAGAEGCGCGSEPTTLPEGHDSPAERATATPGPRPAVPRLVPISALRKAPRTSSCCG
jgi:hypothetical protein